VLIEINPKCRIPRTFKRFSGLFAQLLNKYKIRAAETSEILLKVIKNPVTDHLPSNSPIIATSEKSRLVDLDEYCKSLVKSKPVVFVVGAMSQGDLNIDYSEDSISVSSYPLSAAVVCSKLCTAMEKIYNVL
jgi:rRNA small subunit pseudouridine methyltransferase Nep1